MAGQTTIDAVVAALHAHPGLNAIEVAEQGGLGRSTAAKALATLERQERVHRVLDTSDTAGGRENAARWWLTVPGDVHSGDGEPVEDTAAGDPNPDQQAVAPEAAPAPDTDQEPGVPAVDVPAALHGGERLRKGRLREMVLAQLDAAPDDEHSPTALSKALGRSSGAIANALVRLTLDGLAAETSSKPRRYRATPRRAA